MPEGTITINAKPANRRASALPFVALLIFLQDGQQEDILKIIVKNILLNVGIVRRRRRIEQAMRRIRACLQVINGCLQNPSPNLQKAG
jgi:hypothetical protein